MNEAGNREDLWGLLRKEYREDWMELNKALWGMLHALHEFPPRNICTAAWLQGAIYFHFLQLWSRGGWGHGTGVSHLEALTQSLFSLLTL